MASSFYSAGAKVVLVGSNQRELERVRTQLFSLRPKNVPVYQPEVVTMESNVTEMSAKEAVADIMETCGQVDILINNSTIYARSEVLSTTIDDDIRVMNVNYFSPIAFTKGKVKILTHYTFSYTFDGRRFPLHILATFEWKIINHISHNTTS